MLLRDPGRRIACVVTLLAGPTACHSYVSSTNSVTEGSAVRIRYGVPAAIALSGGRWTAQVLSNVQELHGTVLDDKVDTVRVRLTGARTVDGARRDWPGDVVASAPRDARSSIEVRTFSVRKTATLGLFGTACVIAACYATCYVAYAMARMG